MTATARLGHPAAVRHVPYERWVVYGGPLAVSTAVSMFWPVLHLAVAGVVGAFVVAWLSARPGLALRLLVVVLPVQLLGLAALYDAGAPRLLVRPLGLWKEAMVGAIVVAAIRVARRERHRVDLLDRVALAYVGLGVLFLVVPGALVVGPGAGLPFGTRLNGFRTDVMYVLLLVAARHARIPAAEVVRAARAFVLVALAAGAVAVYEFAAADSWNSFVTGTIGLPRYKLEVLGVAYGTDPYLFDIRAYSIVGGRELLRIGGILVDYLQFGFWLAVAAALALERQVRRLERPVRSLAVVLLVVPVLFTQTRSAVLGVALVVVLALRRQAGRAVAARVRLTLAVGALAALAVPVAIGIGLADRLVGSGDEHSDDLHESSSSTGLAVLFDDPAGRGLATAAGAGVRAGTEGYVVSENQLLQIGTQLGVVGLVLWVGTYGAAVVTLHREVADDEEAHGEREVPAVAAGTALALTALAPSMLFLQIHIYLPFAWTLWSLAGASLGALDARRADRAGSTQEAARAQA